MHLVLDQGKGRKMPRTPISWVTTQLRLQTLDLTEAQTLKVVHVEAQDRIKLILSILIYLNPKE